MFNVVTGLPVERMHLADDFINRVKGERTITTYDGEVGSEINIVINNIEIVPQPLGTYWSSLSNSTITQDEIKVVVDIGFKTTDLASIEDWNIFPKRASLC